MGGLPVMPFGDGRAISAGVELIDGMVLAATARADRGAREALPGLAPGLARALADRIAELDAMTRSARHTRVKEIVERMASVPTDAQLPPRARAILAPDLPRELAVAWSRGAPRVRRGFRVNRAIKLLLRRLAQGAPTEAQEIELVRSAAWRG